MSSEATRQSPLAHVEHPRCPFCHEGVRPEERKQGCVACMAWHHRECWDENGARCATCGAVDVNDTAIVLRPRAPTPSAPRESAARAPAVTISRASATRRGAPGAWSERTRLVLALVAALTAPVVFCLAAVAIGQALRGPDGTVAGGAVGIGLATLAWGAIAYFVMRASRRAAASREAGDRERVE